MACKPCWTRAYSARPRGRPVVHGSRCWRRIREYALEQLAASGEADALRQHHAAYFLALAERAAPEVIGSHQVAWLDRLELEHDNLRAVLAWSRTAACDGSLSGIGLHVAVALREFWIRRGHMSEARRWLEDLLAQVEAGSIPALPPSLRGWALRDLGFLVMMQGDQTGGAALLTASLRLFQALDEPQGMAAALHELGGCALVADDVTGAVPLLEESLALSRALGNGWCMAWSLAFLAEAVYGQNDHDRVLALLEESLASFRDTGDSYGIAYRSHLARKRGAGAGRLPARTGAPRGEPRPARGHGDQLCSRADIPGVGASGSSTGEAALGCRARGAVVWSSRLWCIPPLVSSAWIASVTPGTSGRSRSCEFILTR